MKKRMFLLGLCILLLCGCSATAATTEEMVELARDKIPVSDAENIQMQAAGRVDTENNSALLIVRTGNEWQAHAYYPVTFEKRGGAYVLTHVAKAMPQAGGDGCYGCFWGDGYVLLTDNEACREIRIAYESGEEQTLRVTSLPFVHYDARAHTYLDGDGQAETRYAFLDAQGRELDR